MTAEDGDHRMAVERSGNLERYTAIRENEKYVMFREGSKP